MNYNKAIYFKDGSSKTITEGEFQKIMKSLMDGQKWVMVQGCLISHDTIARVDIHHDTAESQRRENATFETQMMIEGKNDLVDERRRLQQKMAIESAMNENKRMYAELERKSLPMSEEEDNRGDIMHYIGGDGQKYYS